MAAMGYNHGQLGVVCREPYMRESELMNKHRGHRCPPIDSRLLREMTDAAKEFRRSRGANRIVAVHRYVKALHRFTDRALGGLVSTR
jgi:hypothetical protein